MVFEPKRKEEGVIHEGPDDEPVWKRAIKILPGDESKIQVKPQVPLNAANVSSEVIASKPDQNTVGSSGLTATETAYLSNEEKAMRLKQKGLA